MFVRKQEDYVGVLGNRKITLECLLGNRRNRVHYTSRFP